MFSFPFSRGFFQIRNSLSLLCLQNNLFFVQKQKQSIPLEDEDVLPACQYQVSPLIGTNILILRKRITNNIQEGLPSDNNCCAPLVQLKWYTVIFIIFPQNQMFNECFLT